LVGLAAAAALALAGPARSVLGDEIYSAHYDVSLIDPAAGRMDVELRVSGLSRSRLYLGYASSGVHGGILPAANFHVRSATRADGTPLSIATDGDTWELRGARGEVRVRYEVYLDSGRPGGAFAEEAFSSLTQAGARLMGADVFLFPVLGEPEQLTARYQLPGGWRLAHPFQTGESTAAYPSLRSLYHSVVAAGPYRVQTRQVEDCELVLAVLGDFRFDDEVLLDVLSRLVRYELAFLGASPRPRYLFVVNPHPRTGDPDRLHYFGLNFDGSMLLLIDGDSDRERLNAEPAQLCAHEFFHNWLGETVRQRRYDMNWFVEGVTTFYSYQVRMESGMLRFDAYASDLRRRYLDEYRASPLYGNKSVADAGRAVLEEEATTGYLYAGGVLLAASLDGEIDRVTRGTASLDDLVLALVLRARADRQFVLTRHALEEELQRLTDTPFGAWLDDHVYGTQEPPLPEYVTSAAGT
jgi:predicted metalloprotease with PDZ domain